MTVTNIYQIQQCENLRPIQCSSRLILKCAQGICIPLKKLLFSESIQICLRTLELSSHESFMLCINAHPYHLWTVMLGMYGTMTVMPMIVLDCSHRTLCRYLDTISDTRHTNDWDTVTVVRTHLIITFPLLIKVRVGDGFNFLSSEKAKVVANPFHHTIKLGLRSNKRALAS